MNYNLKSEEWLFLLYGALIYFMDLCLPLFDIIFDFGNCVFAD